MRSAALALVVALATPGEATTPAVYLVIVDGLDVRFATAERMPRLFGLRSEEPAHTSIVGARAVMPTRTNPNHVTLLTGVTAEVHGITGNSYWSRVADDRPAKLDVAALVEVETLFTVLASETPARRSAGVFAKPKLARLFAASGPQRAPDVLWSPEHLPVSRVDPATRYASDADTIHAAIALTEKAEPDLTVINLADVDRTAHGRGPDDDASMRAVAGADAAIGRLIDALRARGRWARAVLIVTADHGFASVEPTRDAPYPTVPFGRELLRAGIRGVRLVADGGVEHVYAEGLAADATDVGKAGDTLARVAALAAATPGVAEVLARLPVGDVPRFAVAHPDWHLDHPRTGDLLLVAAPGHQFVDPFDPVDASLRGNHGGPGERNVPLVVTGGWPGLVPVCDAPAPNLTQVAPTIVHVLGVRSPRRLDNRPLPPPPAPLPVLTPEPNERPPDPSAAPGPPAAARHPPYGPDAPPLASAPSRAVARLGL